MTGKLIYAGMAAGAIIIGIATASLIMDLTRGQLEITETFAVGESTSYQITGDADSVHTLIITAESFEMELQSPGDGFAIPRSVFTDSYRVEWMHEESGRTAISLQNTGKTEMVVEGMLSVSVDPIFMAYHGVVITSGVLIVGFTMAMRLRKPRGF